jgi:hypothetical protein
MQTKPMTPRIWLMVLTGENMVQLQFLSLFFYCQTKFILMKVIAKKIHYISNGKVVIFV